MQITGKDLYLIDCSSDDYHLEDKPLWYMICTGLFALFFTFRKMWLFNFIFDEK